jgi:hypothetical protein
MHTSLMQATRPTPGCCVQPTHLVEDVVAALRVVDRHNAAALQQVCADGGAADDALLVEVDFHVLAKAAAVVVAHLRSARAKARGVQGVTEVAHDTHGRPVQLQKAGPAPAAVAAQSQHYTGLSGTICCCRGAGCSTLLPL